MRACWLYGRASRVISFQDKENIDKQLVSVYLCLIDELPVRYEAAIAFSTLIKVWKKQKGEGEKEVKSDFIINVFLEITNCVQTPELITAIGDFI